MPSLPMLDENDVVDIVPEATNVMRIAHGAQKVVFRCTINEVDYALKFMLIPTSDFEDEVNITNSSVFLRAKREVDTLRACQSPHLVTLGNIELSYSNHNKQHIVYFSENLISGSDLRTLTKDKRTLPPSDIACLGRQIGEAISTLWAQGRVHRDIKPGNIIRDGASGNFVLLDAGLVLDVAGESLSYCPVGTHSYYSPEQFEFVGRKGKLDLRSDFFSLGITMYQLATGIHPFHSPGENDVQVYQNIMNKNPVHPCELSSAVSEELGDVIMRLLGKQPHLRFRNYEQLSNALEGV